MSERTGKDVSQEMLALVRKHHLREKVSSSMLGFAPQTVNKRNTVIVLSPIDHKLARSKANEDLKRFGEDTKSAPKGYLLFKGIPVLEGMEGSLVSYINLPRADKLMEMFVLLEDRLHNTS